MCCLLFFVHSACLGPRLELLRPVLRPIDPDPPRHPRRLQQPPDASICASSCCYCRALRLPATVLFCRWRLPQVLASRITASCCQDARRNRDRAYLTWPAEHFPFIGADLLLLCTRIRARRGTQASMVRYGFCSVCIADLETNPDGRGKPAGPSIIPSLPPLQTLGVSPHRCPRLGRHPFTKIPQFHTDEPRVCSVPSCRLETSTARALVIPCAALEPDLCGPGGHAMG